MVLQHRRKQTILCTTLGEYVSNSCNVLAEGSAAAPDQLCLNVCREQLFQKVFDVVDKHPQFMEVLVHKLETICGLGCGNTWVYSMLSSQSC